MSQTEKFCPTYNVLSVNCVMNIHRWCYCIHSMYWNYIYTGT